MRKKILALVTTIVMIFASLGLVVGCGDKPKPDDGKTEEFSAPTITLAYDSVVIGKGANYDLLDGVTVSDKYDANIRVSVKNDGGFKKDVVGKYTVTYSAKNSKEKETTKTRTVEVAEGVLPAMGAFIKKGSALAVPAFSESVKDAALTVSYKEKTAADWTKLEKTGEAYVLDLAAGEYQIKYEANKDKFEYSEIATLKVYEVAAPGNSVTIVGQTVTLGLPTVSDNIDGTIKVYSKTGNADYAEIEMDEASESYKIADITEGAHTVKYVVTVVAADPEKGTAEITEEVTCTVTAYNAQLADRTLQTVTAAGEVALRTPVTSQGVTYTVNAELRDSTRAALTVTDGKITMAAGDIVKVTYAFAAGEVNLGGDFYYIYCARTGANVVDFETGDYTMYVTDNAQNDVLEEVALSGTKSLRVTWYSNAMGNWLGFKETPHELGLSANTIDVYIYLGEHINGGTTTAAFVNKAELWIDTDAGGMYPVDDENHWQTLTGGWAKYTYTYAKSFNTLKTAVLHLNGTNTTDAGYKVYMDDLTCYTAE